MYSTVLLHRLQDVTAWLDEEKGGGSRRVGLCLCIEDELLLYMWQSMLRRGWFALPRRRFSGTERRRYARASVYVAWHRTGARFAPTLPWQSRCLCSLLLNIACFVRLHWYGTLCCCPTRTLDERHVYR